MMTEAPSSTIAGRYEIVALLGEGGMGAVYKARDNRLDRLVAIKTILPQHMSGQQASQRFFREAQAMARLNHPNILTLFDYGQDADTHYLVTELGGRDLGAILETEGAPLNLAKALKVARSVCRALDCAHGHGVIHRDLKPGNVLVGSADEPGWSREGMGDTSVKVMDFGLAKVRGTAAITLARTHVGTPQYMSPEQAMGRETDERSDLYSFGVVLYELLTGIRPFDSEEPQAILSQHLHMPPVPPSAFNPDLPHVMEVLILRLMEKDPSRRPASAAEVLKTLEGMSTSVGAQAVPSEIAPVQSAALSILGRTRSGIIAGVSPLGILPARTPLVGREKELEFLKSQYETSAAGIGGRLVFVTGEAGMGKTRLAGELELYARMRGGTSLEGRYFREGTAPYGPWVEAMRAGLRGLGEDELAAVVGSNASGICQVVPELADLLGPLSSSTSLAPEEARLRLYDCIAGIIANLSQQKPLVLFIDDLQWAPDLAVLMHVARRLGDSRALIIGAYREQEFKEQPALMRDWAELNRARLCNQVALAALSEAETAQIVAHHFGEEPAHQLKQSIYSKTGGNPFFVEEVVRSLAESGVVHHVAAGWEVADPSGVRIPESIKLAMEERVGRLGERARDILLQAAVLGKEFSFLALLAVTGLAEDDLVEQIDRAVDARLLVDRSAAGEERYGFADAQIYEVLYDAITPSRRHRYHLKAGKTLESLYTDRLEAHAEELARHFAEGNDREKAARYYYRAAVKSDRLKSWRLAIHYYHSALQFWEELGGHEEERARACGSLGDVAFYSGIESASAMDHFEKALTLYEELGNRSMMAATHSQIGREYSLGANLALRSQAKALEHLRLARTILEEMPESLALGSAYVELGWAYHMLEDLPQVIVWARKALAIGERLGNPTLVTQSQAQIAAAYQVMGEEAQGPQLLEQSWQLAARNQAGSLADYVRFYGSIAGMRVKNPAAGLAWAERRPDSGSAYSTLHLPEYLSILHALTGDFGMVDRTLEQREKACESLGRPTTSGISWYLGFLLLRRGEWERARGVMEESRQYYTTTHSHHFAYVTAMWLGELYLELEDYARAEEQILFALAGYRKGQAKLWEIWILPRLCELYVRTGQLAKARPHLEEARSILAKPQDWGGLAGDVELAEGLIRAGEDRRDESAAAFQRAIAITRRYSLRWDEARVYYQWASVLLQRQGEDGRAQAESLLKQSLSLWESMEVAPYIARCQARLAKAPS